MGLKKFNEAEALGQSIIREAALRNRKVKEAQALITLATTRNWAPGPSNTNASLAEKLTLTGTFNRLSADVQFRLADIYRLRGQNGMSQRRLAHGVTIAQNTPEIWLLPAGSNLLRNSRRRMAEYLRSRCALPSRGRPC